MTDFTTWGLSFIPGKCRAKEIVGKRLQEVCLIFEHDIVAATGDELIVMVKFRGESFEITRLIYL